LLFGLLLLLCLFLLFSGNVFGGWSNMFWRRCDMCRGRSNFVISSYYQSSVKVDFEGVS
jgi:hypothetical protein